MRSDVESAESNRMLGLAFQGQGQLDMAFDKFRKCPLDDAADGQPLQPGAGFRAQAPVQQGARPCSEYMADHNPKFRDLEQQLSRAKQMSETVILGGGGGRTNASTMILDGGQVEKPMLGRYQVEKELGKGAMGVVYLGHDPKIGRVVAIKTMALSQEFEADELEDVKERFFREAETAGRLNHPNIVTIFDAGEEHDLAYIAMEFLKGKDLAPYTKPGNLLPLPQDAVASSRGWPTRWPTRTRRTSCIATSSRPTSCTTRSPIRSRSPTSASPASPIRRKTKTGMVLGTPSLHVAGAARRARRSTGSPTCFRWASRSTRWRAAACRSRASRWRSSCSRSPTSRRPTSSTLNPALPECLVAIIDKALAKDQDAALPERRAKWPRRSARAPPSSRPPHWT